MLPNDFVVKSLATFCKYRCTESKFKSLCIKKILQAKWIDEKTAVHTYHFMLRAVKH
jgi:hypothetical protein